jgi:hypothetical protein
VTPADAKLAVKKINKRRTNPFANTMSSKKSRKSVERPLNPEPNMEEGMGADYQGLY